MRILMAMALAAALMPVPCVPAHSATAVRDGSHDLDFSIGSWTTEITIVKDPFAPTGETTTMKGTKVTRPIWNGKALLEEIEADGPNGHWQAANLFLYDPTAGQWSQNYVDSADGRMEPPSVGELRDGDLEFYWQRAVGGRTMLVKGTWKVLSSDLHTYQVARSIDGGRSWHPSFTARVTRAK